MIFGHEMHVQPCLISLNTRPLCIERKESGITRIIELSQNNLIT